MKMNSNMTLTCHEVYLLHVQSSEIMKTLKYFTLLYITLFFKNIQLYSYNHIIFTLIEFILVLNHQTVNYPDLSYCSFRSKQIVVNYIFQILCGQNCLQHGHVMKRNYVTTHLAIAIIQLLANYSIALTWFYCFIVSARSQCIAQWLKQQFDLWLYGISMTT